MNKIIIESSKEINKEYLENILDDISTVDVICSINCVEPKPNGVILQLNLYTKLNDKIVESMNRLLKDCRIIEWK